MILGQLMTLLENCSQPYVLADLAYLSYELTERLPSLDSFTSKYGKS